MIAVLIYKVPGSPTWNFNFSFFLRGHLIINNLFIPCSDAAQLSDENTGANGLRDRNRSRNYKLERNYQREGNGILVCVDCCSLVLEITCKFYIE